MPADLSCAKLEPPCVGCYNGWHEFCASAAASSCEFNSMQQILFVPTFAGWQKEARLALAHELHPQDLIWEEWAGEQPALPLFDDAETHTGSGADNAVRPAVVPPFRVPREFVAMAKRVACHRDVRRWALLYAVLWRITHGEPRLLQIAVDYDVHELMRLDKAVRHDVHKMRAFVRFRQVSHDGAAWYVAWFEPQHHIVELNAGFFRDRFAQMNWSILTPERCVHWDGNHLSFTAGVPRSEAPDEDRTEELWKQYYGSIFNPARVKVQAMLSEMPKRYWKNLPEAALIPALLNEAPERVEKMRQDSAMNAAPEHVSPAIASPPGTKDWAVLKKASHECRACPLWRNATQTVFGEGPTNARLVVVGEQPGDQEDLAGHPFVGPAGQLLDRAFEEAGIDRSQAYVTNAVKHFKWEPRGKRRLHQKPDTQEIAACRPWLMAELEILRPTVLLCLGGTAAASVFGRQVRVLTERGEVRETSLCAQTVVTVHPSSLLRTPDENARAEQYALFVRDLKRVARLLAE